MENLSVLSPKWQVVELSLDALFEELCKAYKSKDYYSFKCNLIQIYNRFIEVL